jgi:hypothetical protein
MADNQYVTERLFAESLAARGDAAVDHPEITLKLRVQAAAALAAVTVALSAWAQSDGADQLPTLVDALSTLCADRPWAMTTLSRLLLLSAGSTAATTQRHTGFREHPVNEAVRPPGRLCERPNAGAFLVLLLQVRCELVPGHAGDPAALLQVGHLETPSFRR